MSSLRLLPVLKNTAFKVYISKTLITTTSRRYANIASQFYINQLSAINYGKLKRDFSTKSDSIPSKKRNNNVDDDNIFVKIAEKIPFLNINKHRMNVVGLLLYEAVVDKAPYSAFIEEFSLPDTFYSWFCITELHVWLLSVRCMCEGEDGHIVRNRLIEAMWSDVGQRVKKLGAGNSPLIRKQVQELSEQFQAALIGYDEGLMTDDVTLAAALWRRMYQMRVIDLDHLEILIGYIRRQIVYLDDIPTKQLFSAKEVLWDFDRRK